MALRRSRTKPTTEEKPSRRKADENREEDSRAGGRKERLRLRRKYWGAEGLGYGIDRSIVFGRHCPQYGDKTRRKKVPCYRTKAWTDKKWNRGGDGREMKTEGNRRQIRLKGKTCPQLATAGHQLAALPSRSQTEEIKSMNCVQPTNL